MLEGIQIKKSFHGIEILHNVTLQLEAGECVGISGPNGCGKTTLLKILAQVIPPDSGKILYNGKSVLGNRKFLRNKLGYVPQNNDLLPELTAEQQLRLWCSACRSSWDVPEHLTEILGLETLMKVRIGKMSGGMQRRVSIAMALLSSPQILIMDEATTGLDADYRTALMEWLKTYLHNGGSVIWCSHAQEEFDYLCHKVYTISSGNMLLK